MSVKDYVPPTVTVDGVIFQLKGGRLHVLLIKRDRAPFKGYWALPGGYNAAGETTVEAFARILRQKAGVDTAKLKHVEQLYTFDSVAHDPRGHAVSVTYLGLGGVKLARKTGKSVQNPTLFPVDKLPELAHDHAEIVKYACERLRSKITYTNAIQALLPAFFTLSQLQSAYEIILGRQLDKRNFRKKILSLGLITVTRRISAEGAHRPARLYKFSHPELHVLERSFD